VQAYGPKGRHSFVSRNAAINGRSSTDKLLHVVPLSVS
jgi:hypothetical protein